ncbi:LysM peptidoglycan-binding domain-containing protein [Pseudobacteroides cellulosolvens]|uniref:Peptidoglycan-binding lysin domain-containing protein n=1 Tax=Pseudobacteroides cellulosolvens ATCC 35603 = DSM 2933 TaxID=398512 RepID=A0A0L6JKZ4_9FIRM|nr:LysM peptidoglycan-binding domain-containing protein [Pseudobacteroides cellulosolvens]KNY26491.1 Peptidoglycan-binding lysin domain-containing protein [Pseudobacteroides cellulosolvens ATCC 35603 = DSM 2933]
MAINCTIILNKFGKIYSSKLKRKLAGAIIAFCFLLIVVFATSILCVPSTAYAQTLTSYTVKSGDLLWEISQKFNTTIRGIMELNNMTGTDIYVGQVLKIPPPEDGLKIRYIEYRVRSGDTLGILAEHFGTDIRSIKILNGIEGYTIYQGDILKIPAEFVDYMVIRGDTLYEVATRFGTTIWKIRLFNRLNDYDLYVGQVLHIPYVAKVPEVRFITHIVQSGDTSWIISNRYGVPMQELLSVNNLSQSSELSVGQQIRVPVYAIPVRLTPGPQYGEYLDWYTEAQYLFPIGKQADIIDFVTGKRFKIQRTIGASHADCEPLTSTDSQIIKELWGGNYSWATRAVLVVVGERKIAASMSSTPHDIEYIENNNFTGHFDIHFKNSRRHVDNAIDEYHQAKIRIAAGAE